MRQSGKCPKCGSQDIVANAKPRLQEHVESVDLVVYDKPDALLFKGEKERYELAAWICKACGYTEWYCL
jgi:predicted nucleic-acid-binding Zn-ribbon protein